MYGDRLPAMKPDLVLSCGDLPFDYLEYLVSRLDVPVFYVPGNHDLGLKPPDMTWMPLRSELQPVLGPEGCTNIDGRLVERLRPPARMAAAVAGRVKLMAGLSLSQRTLPQEGTARVMFDLDF